MPGTTSGSVDHLTNTAAANTSNQEQFVNLFRFFNGPLRSGSYVELVALNTGSSAGGTNYWNEGGPMGENAWVVWRVRSGSVGTSGVSSRRAVDYYVLFQWADAVNFGTTPGNPGLLNNSTGDGVGYQVAWRDDGLSPWAGTTLANGNDVKAAQVWQSGSSSIHVFPRSNSPGGLHNNARENCALMFDFSAGSTAYRYHFLHDRDSFFAIYDSGDNLGYNGFHIHGTFEPLTGFVTTSGGNAQMPMVAITDSSTALISLTTAYGSVTGSQSSEGGIAGPRMTTGATVRDVKTDRYSNNLMNNTSFQPNPQFVASRYDEFKIPVIVSETPDFGLAGFLDMIGEVYNASVHDITSGGLKAVLGQTAGAAVEFIVPWSGSAPGGGSTRQGRQF